MLVETTSSTVVAPMPSNPARPEREALERHLFTRRGTLAESLADYVGDGGAHLLPHDIAEKTTPHRQFREYGFSGYELFLGDGLSGKIELAPLQWGGFALRKTLNDGAIRREVCEIYSEDGSLQAIEPRMDRNVLFVELTDMEPGCVIVSHLYNYLAHEYAQASLGSARSRQAAWAERMLRDLENPESSSLVLSVKRGAKDSGIKKLYERMIEVESDPVLDWEERQKVLNGILTERQKLIATKTRVHQLSWFRIAPRAMMDRIINWATRAAMRPMSNLKGITYRHTIGLAIWFFQTVRGNIGYSIALAIYGPFTFYFITQPLNPHAMWAVGKVRTAYLETVQKTKLTFGIEDVIVPVAAVAATATSDSSSANPASPTAANPAVTIANRYSSLKPGHGTMLVGSDVREVDSQDWGDRMSNFKAMQIGYEGNMEFAARMGRIEQMETQLNYPMIADTAWQELTRFEDRASKIVASLENSGKGSNPAAVFLRDEIARTRDLQLYVWDRMLRFIIDHPYIVMDLSGEQTYRDYYLGRSFIILKKMTEAIAKRHPDMKKPADYKTIERLAGVFEKSRVEGKTVLERLKLNSRLFAQKDRFDGQELRSYMKREWEILYLLQMKAQEASNFGLQAYTWSIRNALWSIQSIYSTKSRELALLFPSGENGVVRTDLKISSATEEEIRQSIEPLYESAFHLLNLDYVSLRPELSEKLKDDIEFLQRKTVIDRLEASLSSREKMLSSMNREGG